MDISILIPAYNASQYLEKCIRSIAAQMNFTFTFETIIVNDGSTDDTALLIDRLKNDYPKLSIQGIHQSNKGTGSARNTALNAASGDFLWFIDSDDTITDGAFSIVDSALRSANKEETLVFNYNRVDGSGVSTPNLPELAPSAVEYYLPHEFIVSKRPSYLWLVLYVRSYIDHHHIRFIEGIKNLEDYEFNMKYFAVVKKVRFINERIYNYSDNQTSTSRNAALSNLLKLAADSATVHQKINSDIRSMASNDYQKALTFCNALSISGFFYSLMNLGYPFPHLKSYYKEYAASGLLPVRIYRKDNLKLKLFKAFINSNRIFLWINKLKKKS